MQINLYEGVSFMLLNNFLKKAVYEIVHHKQLKEQRKKKKLLKKQKRENHVNSMLKLFGRTRYYLAFWVGNWILVTWNKRDYRDIEYQKFYKDNAVAKRYANKIKEKYDTVDIQKTYDKNRIITGYLLIGRGKKAAPPTPIPTNVINFNEFKSLKTLKLQQH